MHYAWLNHKIDHLVKSLNHLYKDYIHYQTLKSCMVAGSLYKAKAIQQLPHYYCTPIHRKGRGRWWLLVAVVLGRLWQSNTADY
jgi:hypothetical protein